MLLRIARLVLLGWFITTAAAASADEAEVIRDAWSDIYLDAAKEIVLSATIGDDPIELVEKPLMRWHNPVRRGETHGDFFVWQSNGQPVVVGTIFSYILPLGGNTRVAAMGLHPLIQEDIRYQFRNVSGTLLTANLDQFDVEIETPAASITSATRQLAQLRSLARTCQGWTVNDSVEQPLRLMSQPLLQTDASSLSMDRKEVRSGLPETEIQTAALFAMVTGTDPELLILIQPKPSGQPGRSMWQITPARFSDLPISFSVNGKEVWERHVAANPEPYVSRHRIFTLPLDPR